jgi:hypothetical protein
MTSPLLESAAEVWEHLVKEGGMQPRAWDEPLVDELRAKLGLGDGPVIAELTSQAVTTEAFVYALFDALELFAAMMGDLLALFERHGIVSSDGSAEMVFDFEDPGRAPLRFDLESFRRAHEVWSRARAPAVDLDWIRESPWELVRIARNGAGSRHWTEPRPGTAGWFEAYMERGEWPPTAIALPPTGSPELDRELARAASIWAAMVGLMRARAPNREALREAARSDDVEETAEAQLLRLLWWIESDYFVLQLASHLTDIAEAGARTQDAMELASDLRPSSTHTRSRAIRSRSWFGACSTYSPCPSGGSAMSCTRLGCWSNSSTRRPSRRTLSPRSPGSSAFRSELRPWPSYRSATTKSSSGPRCVPR